ncbi:unnamed protein product, partial [Prorocentrum cordatum]
AQSEDDKRRATITSEYVKNFKKVKVLYDNAILQHTSTAQLIQTWKWAKNSPDALKYFQAAYDKVNAIVAEHKFLFKLMSEDKLP